MGRVARRRLKRKKIRDAKKTNDDGYEGNKIRDAKKTNDDGYEGLSWVLPNPYCRVGNIVFYDDCQNGLFHSDFKARMIDGRHCSIDVIFPKVVYL